MALRRVTELVRSAERGAFPLASTGEATSPPSRHPTCSFVTYESSSAGCGDVVFGNQVSSDLRGSPPKATL